MFRKAHMLVGVQSRAILSVVIAKSKYHDMHFLPKMWKRGHKRLKRQFQRVHWDKACWSKTWIEKMVAQGIFSMIPIKKNFKDQGAKIPVGKLINLQKRHRGIYKKNYKTHLRAAVNHIFGEITLYATKIQDKIPQNRDNTLLITFLRYNLNLYAREVIAC